VVTIDSTTISQGYIRARVTDDEDTPIPGMEVHFYIGSSHEYRGAGTTDIEGYSRLNITLGDGELLEAVVNENEFYHGSSQQVTVTIIPDFLLLGVAGGSVFILAVGVALSRKIIRGRSASAPPAVSPEVSEALREERDSIPERVREHSERRIAELDEIGREGEDSSSTMEERD
jgi:hypothetical protein